MPVTESHQVSPVTEKMQKFELLVDELIKKQCDDQMVKVLMNELGVDYSDDPTIRINRVLQALHNSK